MSNVQVKNIEPQLHDELRARAAEAGTTISEYVLQLIRRDLQRPARQAWLGRVASLPRHQIDRDEITASISAERDRR